MGGSNEMFIYSKWGEGGNIAFEKEKCLRAEETLCSIFKGLGFNHFSNNYSEVKCPGLGAPIQIFKGLGLSF